MRILLDTIFDTASGYGNDGVGLARALNKMGHHVMLAPRSLSPPLPADVAMMLTTPLEPPMDVTITHVDPPHIYAQPGYRITSERMVAWSMWEWQTFNDEMLEDEKVHIPLHKRLSDFDLMLSYDEVTYGALDPYTNPHVHHKILQGGYWPDDWRLNPQDREWGGTFRYVMVGQLHQRKDPFVAIRAFNALKEEHGDEFDAELHLKTTIRGLHPAIEDAYPGVKIHCRFWSQQELLEFYATSHCLLAPSRGEGKNVPALEAMTTGMPVIATNWSGHTVWLRESYAYPLSYTLKHEDGGTQARADEDELRKLMWHVYEHRDEARAKGELASRTIPNLCGWENVTEHLMQFIVSSPKRQVGASL